MPPYSPNFDWLGYGSINFVDGMGSILVFAIFQIFALLLAIGIAALKVKCCLKCRSFAKMETQTTGMLDLIHGTFFECLVCVSMSMRMFEYDEFLVDADRVSLGFTCAFAVILVLYIALIVYFMAFKSPKVVLKARA